MSAHSSGPWHTHENRLNARTMGVNGADGTAIASVHVMVNEREQESRANARLIAAAPALLAALRGLLHHNAGEITCECCQTERHDCVFCQARAALAKAEGREP